MMDRYLAQYADEAFKAVLSDKELEQRLQDADALLHTPSNDLIDAAPDHIKAALQEVRDTRAKPFPERANAIRVAIEEILEEFARQTARNV